MENETTEKLSLLCELINMAKSDSNLREEEITFLASIARQIGITEADFVKAFDEAVSFTPPKSEVHRIVQFQRLLLVMHIDQEASADELKLVRDLAIRMGLSSLATEEVLRIMGQYPNSLVPAEKLIEIFQLQHN
jgi:predicted glycosyltransferase